MKITTEHLVLDTDKLENTQTIRRVYCVHNSSDRLRYVMEVDNELKVITSDHFLEISKDLEKYIFDSKFTNIN